MAHHTPDGPAEMLECLDILLSAALYKQDTAEHKIRVVALHDYYDNIPHANFDDADDSLEEFNAQYEVLAAMRPKPSYTDEEFDTALWQTAQLGMNLLLDQEALVQTLDEMTQAQEVSRIITPELDDIQRINER